MSSELTLRLGLYEGRNANAAIAAESLLAWVYLVEEAARAINPHELVVVELVGTAEGSLKLKSLLKCANDAVGSIKEGAAEYPHLRTLAAGLALAVGPVLLDRAIPENLIVEADAQSEAKSAERVAQSQAVQLAKRRLLQTVEKDPAVDGITVEDDEGVVAEVPRSAFPEREGLFQIEEAAPAERTTRDVWDAVLLKATFAPKRRRWTFLRGGLPFSALMDDAKFLQAIREGRVPIALQEGVSMRLEIEFTEKQDGQVWVPIQKTRRVVRVLQPVPMTPEAMAGRPEKR
jgi:hypothetical protein